MRKQDKKSLYESIMRDVAKTVKKHLNEENEFDKLKSDTKRIKELLDQPAVSVRLDRLEEILLKSKYEVAKGAIKLILNVLGELMGEYEFRKDIARLKKSGEYSEDKKISSNPMKEKYRENYAEYLESVLTELTNEFNSKCKFGK